ncbi:hypothetical protein BIY24_12055 [Halobacteriovorax marinus]|uniref:hypothetical protein n=1 Tax=Halobacteriovorax marinus TaxID=97084 RepID=UPI000BC2D646|nr:hypothetical protein [Halobacteriovorax marinus]ATH08653.1 hypothetical protein BIY24_12055 [Halobacteriovorax marinus]
MVRVKKLLFYFLCITLLVSCASRGRKISRELRSMVKQGDYANALKSLEASEFFKKNPESKLLYLMEKGLIYHGLGRYAKSIEVFEEAKTLARKQYTVRVSKKLKTYIANESSDIYYGEKYELSTLFYYQALNHFILSYKDEVDHEKLAEKGEIKLEWKKQSDNDKRQSLFRARAELLAWDSFLKDLKNERSGNPVFKNDLSAKILGARIHETIGTSQDREIAYQLYKDANILLIKNYNAYKAFNMKNVDYIKSFEKFPKMGMEKVVKDYISMSTHQKELKNFLDEKVLSLSKKLRPRTWRREIAPFKIDTKKIKTQETGNISILIEEGIIPAKIPSKQFFGLGESLTKESPAMAMLLGSFAADVLGLMPPAGTYDPVGANVGMAVGYVAATQAAISFELPVIEEHHAKGSFVLEVWSDKSKVKEKIIPLVNPMGDIAEQAVVEQSAWLYPKLGARLATKHVIAILAAYATYKSLKDQNEFLAKSGAVLQYVASSKGIEASEQADTRQWATIPASIRMTELNLLPGTYNLKLRVEGLENSTKSIGQVMVESKKKKYFIQKRVNF